MAQHHGQFVWYELLTTDPDSAVAFYTEVIGWQARDSGLPNHNYTILSAGETPVGGLMAWPQAARDSGARPFWMGYIGVDDVDIAVDRLTAAGGGLHRAAETIPGVGRFAVVADPQGAPFTLFTPSAPAPTQQPPSFAPGHIGWRELHAADRETAFAFYEAQYGWTKTSVFAMGPRGLCQLFATGEPSIGGGMMTKTGNFPTPIWLYYINVEHIEHPVARATAAGGQLLNGPHQVPTGQWTAHCLDPQGAFFAMVAPDHSTTA